MDRPQPCRQIALPVRTASLDVAHPDIGRPMRRHPVIQKGLSELVDGADVVIGQAQTREAAAVRQLLVRGPAEQIAIKCLCATGVGGSEVEPAKLSGIRFAKMYHGATLLPCRPKVPPFAGNGRAAPGNQAASVIGSMNGAHLGDLCRRKAAELGVLFHRGFALGAVNAKSLVFDHVGMLPLALAGELRQRAVGCFRQRPCICAPFIPPMPGTSRSIT